MKKPVAIVLGTMTLIALLTQVNTSLGQYYDESIVYNPGRCDRMAHPYDDEVARKEWEKSGKNPVVGHYISTYTSLQDVIYCMKELFNEIQENERSLYYLKEDLEEALKLLRSIERAR